MDRKKIFENVLILSSLGGMVLYVGSLTIAKMKDIDYTNIEHIGAPPHYIDLIPILLCIICVVFVIAIVFRDPPS